MPQLKKREFDFNIQRCLFKFVFINQEKSIDYDSMNRISSFNQDDVIVNSLFKKDCFIRATHTNTDYKLISTNTPIYPKNEFYFAQIKRKN